MLLAKAIPPKLIGGFVSLYKIAWWAKHMISTRIDKNKIQSAVL